jgi:hypothetical protein
MGIYQHFIFFQLAIFTDFPSKFGNFLSNLLRLLKLTNVLHTKLQILAGVFCKFTILFFCHNNISINSYDFAKTVEFDWKIKNADIYKWAPTGENKAHLFKPEAKP